MKKLFFFLFSILVFIFLGACSSTETIDPTATSAVEVDTPVEVADDEWSIVWQDEFDGDAINPEYWIYDIGGDGWGNNESQYYSDRPENAYLEDGMLVIEAREEEFKGKDYTSARLKTQELLTWTYGRFESRIKIPRGQGIWPALWMLGEDIPKVGWPQSGEIDIMENIGRELSTVHGTVHGPGYSGADGVGAGYSLDGEAFADDFHVYVVEWEPEEIRWYVDGNLYNTVTPADVSGEWVYDHPFFILLNIAVGGAWPGYPDETTEFPQKMFVDYIRVYQTPALIAAASFSGGEIHVSDLTIEAQESGDNWQAVAYVTVVDAAGEPVEGATVSAGWLGLVRDGDKDLKTNEEGVAGPFLSDETTGTGSIDFCITSLSKSRFDYIKEDNTKTCVFLEK